MKFQKILTTILILVVSVSIGLFSYNELEQSFTNYNSSITYSITKLSHSFDYSCDQTFYALYVQVTNSGEKVVRDFSISISNELCKGAIPPLPNTLESGETLEMYLYTTKLNGSITISGNNTNVYVRF